MEFFKEAVETLKIVAGVLNGKQYWYPNFIALRHINSSCHAKKPQTQGLLSHQNANWHYIRPG